jgi:hypothetical protein
MARAALGLVVVLGIPGVASAAREDPRPKPPTAAQRAAGAAKALAWLRENLDRVPETQGSPRRPFTVAIAALDSLLASGTTRERAGGGSTRAAVADLARWIDEVERRSKDASQLPARHGVADSRALVQYTWPLGASLLFFAECRARGVLVRETAAPTAAAVRVLVAAQDRNGGFGHGRVSGERGLDPFPSMPGAPGYPSTLVSATNVAAIGLGAMRRFAPAGVDVAEPVRALRAHYVRAILPNGNFPYDVSQRSAGDDPTGVGRTAGAVAAMLLLGEPRSSEPVRRATGFLDARLDLLPEGHGSPALNVFLGALQATLRGPAAVKAFEDRWLGPLLAAQAEDGSLDCVCDGRGFGVTCDSPEKGLFPSGVPAVALGQRAYVTALHLFPLLLDRPDRLRSLGPAPEGREPAPETTPVDPPAGR